MGTDVWTESGIIKTTEAMCGLITEKNTFSLIAVSKRYVNSLKKEEDRKILEPICKLTSLSDRYDFVDALKLIMSNKENWSEFDGFIYTLWNKIVKKANPKLPKIGEIKVFDNPRESGWNVPIDEPCFVFSDSGMYKKVLTNKGKNFKKHLGDCEETNWSVMSY
jgi:hypothetical protein